MRVQLSDTSVGVLITALDFCLMGEGEVFIDENGDDDPVQVAAAVDVLARLMARRNDI